MISLFKKKPKITAAERAKELSAQGFSEPQIIKTMKDEGYSPKDVDAALREIVKKAVEPGLPRREEIMPAPAIRPIPFEELPEERPPRRPGVPAEALPEVPLPGMEEWKPPELPPKRPEIEEEMPTEEMRIPPLKAKEPIERRAEIEEIAEAIIAERWETFERERDEIRARLDNLTSRLETIEAAVRDVVGIKKSDIDAIKGGLESYRASLGDMASRMESLERVMRDALTPMLTTLRALSDTIKELKEKKEK
ncbi:MAG: hypothetical protein QXG26_00795 [Candidatus Aenigmatarchaeota archaeon]